MINNRQAGRRRGRGGNGNNGGNGGGNGPRSNQGQRDNGNRIDNRARGNANQLYEKYKNLASDAQRQGDRVNTEYYLQFADHYFRVLSETRNRFEEQNQRRQTNDGYEAQAFVGSFDTGFDNQDDEYGDEGEPIRSGEQAFGEDRQAERGDRDGNQQNAQQNGQNGQQRGDRDGGQRAERDTGQRSDRDGGQRGERTNGYAQNGQAPRREGRPPRDDARPARDGNRRDDEGAERYQGERQQAPRDHANREPQPPRSDYEDDGEQRNAAPRDGVARDEGREAPRRAPRTMRNDSASEPMPSTEQDGAAAVDAPAVDAAPEGEAPRRRGRPRRERPADDAPMGFDAAVLPPALGVAPTTAPEGEEKPRRRRVRTTPTEATPG